AGKRRSWAIRTNCGQRGFWPATPVSTDQRRGTRASVSWSRARCARFSTSKRSSRTRCATTWNAATPSSKRRWRKFCASTAKNFRHLLFELGVAAFQVVAHLVRLDLLLVENLAHRALDQLTEARVPLRWSVLTGVAGQKPRCPQFV